MNKKLIGAAVVCLVVFGAAAVGLGLARADEVEVRSGSIPVGTRPESQLKGLAKITPAQAIQAAQARAGGRVLEVELENENGFLVYGVEIRRPDRSTVDLKVDAGNGRVLAMERDDQDRGPRGAEASEGERGDDD
jgi:hypothetical protein